MLVNNNQPSGAVLLCNSDFKLHILKKLKDILNNSHIDPSVFNLTRLSPDNIMKTIREYPHLIAVLEHSRRYYLLLTVFKSLRICVFIEMTDGVDVKMFVTTSLSFSKDVHDDTLFVGEFDSDFKTYTLVDVIGKNGLLFDRINLCKRSWFINHIMNHEYRHRRNAMCHIVTPQFYHYEDVLVAMEEAHVRNINKLTFKSMHLKFADIIFDGAVEFVPPPPPPPPPSRIVHQQHVQPAKKHKRKLDLVRLLSNNDLLIAQESMAPCDDIIDDNVEDGAEKRFWVSKVPRPDTYLLYESEEDDVTKRVAGINSLKLSLVMRSLFDSDVKKQLNCTYSKKINRWIPVVA